MKPADLDESIVDRPVMNSQLLPVNWFDFAVVIVLLLGIVRGRKNGLSQELLVMLQWVAIVFASGFLYKPAGDFMSKNTVFSELFCYLTCYIVIAMLVKIAFTLIKRLLGGKIIGSDVFGKAEYYVGMPAGMIRFACLLIFAISILGARYYSPEEISAKARYDADVYGKSYWPTLSSVQINVFQESFSGPYIKKYLEPLLITPTAPSRKVIERKEFQAY